MKPSRIAVLLVCLAIATIGTVVAPGVSAASTAHSHQIICQSMRSEYDAFQAPVALSGCQHLGLTGGSGTESTESTSGPYPITWSTGKVTTWSLVSTSGGMPNRCLAPQFEIDGVGKIVTVSGPWTKQYLGELVTYDACVTQRLAFAGLVPGTVFAIG
jgi:hypothetical protein